MSSYLCVFVPLCVRESAALFSADCKRLHKGNSIFLRFGLISPPYPPPKKKRGGGGGRGKKRKQKINRNLWDFKASFKLIWGHLPWIRNAGVSYYIAYEQPAPRPKWTGSKSFLCEAAGTDRVKSSFHGWRVLIGLPAEAKFRRLFVNFVQNRSTERATSTELILAAEPTEIKHGESTEVNYHGVLQGKPEWNRLFFVVQTTEPSAAKPN